MTYGKFCPRCGAANFIPLHNCIAACKGCSWRIYWHGPVWGIALRRDSRTGLESL